MDIVIQPWCNCDRDGGLIISGSLSCLHLTFCVKQSGGNLLHLLPLWNTDLHWMRVFPLMVAWVKNRRDIGSSSSYETLVCADRPLERGWLPHLFLPPLVLGITESGISTLLMSSRSCMGRCMHMSVCILYKVLVMGGMCFTLVTCSGFKIIQTLYSLSKWEPGQIVEEQPFTL